eukprot:s1156_g12.t1
MVTQETRDPATASSLEPSLEPSLIKSAKSHTHRGSANPPRRVHLVHFAIRTSQRLLHINSIDSINSRHVIDFLLRFLCLFS